MPGSSDLPWLQWKLEAPGRRGADALGWSCVKLGAVSPLVVILILLSPKIPLP